MEIEQSVGLERAPALLDAVDFITLHGACCGIVSKSRDTMRSIPGWCGSAYCFVAAAQQIDIVIGSR